MNDYTVKELKSFLKAVGVTGYSGVKKAGLIRLVKKQKCLPRKKLCNAARSGQKFKGCTLGTTLFTRRKDYLDYCDVLEARPSPPYKKSSRKTRAKKANAAATPMKKGRRKSSVKFKRTPKKTTKK